MAMGKRACHYTSTNESIGEDLSNIQQTIDIHLLFLNDLVTVGCCAFWDSPITPFWGIGVHVSLCFTSSRCYSRLRILRGPVWY